MDEVGIEHRLTAVEKLAGDTAEHLAALEKRQRGENGGGHGEEVRKLFQFREHGAEEHTGVLRRGGGVPV